MRHDGDEWQEANGCLGDLSNDQSHLKVTCLVFLPRDIEMQEWNATFAWWVSTFWHFHTLFFVAFSYSHVLVPLPFHTRLSRPQFYDSKQIRGEKQRYLLSFQSYSELIFHKFFFFFFFAACTNGVRYSLFNGRDFQRVYPLWRIARHTWISLRMDRARESQSTGELILSVPNCIYWPCLAPPNPGLWWCINSCDWLFTRHLLAGVNIMRQIPPITLITPLPGLCRLPRAEPRWRKGQGCAEADSHFLALAIVTSLVTVSPAVRWWCASWTE